MSDEKPAEPEKGSDEVTMSKAEADQLRRKAAEGEKRSRKLEAELEALKEKLDDAEAGTDELAKITRERDREKAKAEQATARITELEGEIETGKRRATVTAVAKRLGMRNPEIAVRLIDGDSQADEQKAEQAIKGLLKSDPYLKAPGNGQRDVTGTEPAASTGGSESSESSEEPTGEARLSVAYANTGGNQKE